MSDQFSLAMMVRLIDDLTRRVEMLEDALAEDEEGEPQTYMDGTPV